MKQTTEELKAIIAGAPVGCTHSDNERDYFKRTDNTQRSATQWEMWIGHNWYVTHGTPDFALSDIAEIIKLREQIERLRNLANNLVKSRQGDINTVDGSVAAVDIDELIFLESYLEGNG